MNKTDLLVMGAVVAVWVVQQNQKYQNSANKIANASQPIGHLAGTVDRYMPVIVGAFDYWAHAQGGTQA